MKIKLPLIQQIIIVFLLVIHFFGTGSLSEAGAGLILLWIPSWWIGNILSSMRCCKCKKIVWPWNESSLTIGIHRSCHQKILDDAAKDPRLRDFLLDELRDRQAECRINITTNDWR